MRPSQIRISSVLQFDPLIAALFRSLACVKLVHLREEKLVSSLTMLADPDNPTPEPSSQSSSTANLRRPSDMDDSLQNVAGLNNGKRPSPIEDSEDDEPLIRRTRIRRSEAPEISRGNESLPAEAGVLVGYCDGNGSLPVYSNLNRNGKKSITYQKGYPAYKSRKNKFYVQKAANTLSSPSINVTLERIVFHNELCRSLCSFRCLHDHRCQY